MPPRIELEEQRDFGGGLNLKDDPYKLERNESFDLQNVDIDRRGGFGIRRGSKRFINTVVGLGQPDSGYTYVDTSGVRHILVARDGNVKRWDGAAWQNVITGLAVAGRTRFAEFRNVLYILPPGQIVPYTWTGAGLATVLTTVVGNYNDDLTAPNAGNFPASRCIATHKEVMWAAGVIDTGPVTHNSRVRWSHPGAAQDWRTIDFIDVDPDDESGFIRALVPFGDRLLVFKDKSIHAIHGAPPAGFNVELLTKELGTPSQWSVKATEEAVYFWDKDKGAWKYDGKKFEWIFEPIFRLIDDEKINVPFTHQVIVEFFRDRLWISVPMLAPPYANQSVGLVFDPTTSRGGSWTIHTKTLFGWWVHQGSDGGDIHLVGGYVGADPGGGYLYELDVEGLFEDEFLVAGPSFVMSRIVAWYTTRWFDNRPKFGSAVKKRWKRPVIIMRANSTQRTIVEVMSDYDPTYVSKTFELFTQLDGTEAQWDVSDWDEAVWAREVTLGGERSVVLRGSPLGSGIAKAMRFKNTTQGQDWRVHGIIMKWISKRIRN